jgi:hypothetical protein
LQAGEIAVQTALRQVLIPGAEAWPKALVQCRGAMTPKPGHDSRCRSLIANDAGIRVKGHNVTMLTAEVNAKTVTSLLTLPSVLGAGEFFLVFIY